MSESWTVYVNDMAADQSGFLIGERMTRSSALS